jgi:hypothetical protein
MVEPLLLLSAPCQSVAAATANSSNCSCCCSWHDQMQHTRQASAPVVKKVADWNMGMTADPSTLEALLPATHSVSIDKAVLEAMLM